jgi:chromosome segregation ATPase
MERLPQLVTDVELLKSGQQQLDKLLKSSIDDIKATIRSEVADLKSEQIGDLRRAFDGMASRIDRQSTRMDKMEREQDRWQTGKSIANWLIRTVLVIAGVLVGYFGATHKP